MAIRSFHFVGLYMLLLGCGDAGRIDAACQSNGDCLPTEICATGLCTGGVGVCNERPMTCPDTDAPVCGCDDQTYQNPCFATMARVRLARTGPCLP